MTTTTTTTAAAAAAAATTTTTHCLLCNLQLSSWGGTHEPKSGAWFQELRPISIPRLSLLRFVDSKLQGNPLWTWEFHPLNLRFCLSQTLRNPESWYGDWPYLAASCPRALLPGRVILQVRAPWHVRSVLIVSIRSVSTSRASDPRTIAYVHSIMPFESSHLPGTVFFQIEPLRTDRAGSSSPVWYVAKGTFGATDHVRRPRRWQHASPDATDGETHFCERFARGPLLGAPSL